MTDACRIGVATRDDIDGILELQERNLRKNGGVLSVPLSREWLQGAIGDMPIIVARKGDRLIGYAVSSPLTAQSDDPILHAMLAAHPGSPGCYVYGPICVADSERGHGVARAIFEALRHACRGVKVSPSSVPTTQCPARFTQAWGCGNPQHFPWPASTMSSLPIAVEPRHGSLESIRMKAMRQMSLPRLTQAWLVPCWTSTSPAFMWISESSSSMSISPSITMA